MTRNLLPHCKSRNIISTHIQCYYPGEEALVNEQENGLRSLLKQWPGQYLPLLIERATYFNVPCFRVQMTVFFLFSRRIMLAIKSMIDFCSFH